MDQRKLIVADYFKLYVLLNKGNRHSNEKTSLQFKFQMEVLGALIFVAYLEDSSNDSKIQLCRFELGDGWTRSGYSGLRYFELFCADVFNRGCEKLKIDLKKRAPNSEEIAELVNCLKKELRSLGF